MRDGRTDRSRSGSETRRDKGKGKGKRQADAQDPGQDPDDEDAEAARQARDPDWAFSNGRGLPGYISDPGPGYVQIVNRFKEFGREHVWWVRQEQQLTIQGVLAESANIEQHRIFSDDCDNGV